MMKHDKIRLTLKSFWVACVLALSVCHVAYSQSPNDQQARAYYFEAERAVGMEEFDDALSAIMNAEQLLGATNAATTAIKVKIYYGQGKYQKAKRELKTFYTLDAGESLARAMAPYLTRIDNKIKEENAQVEADRLAGIAAEKARLKAERVRLAAIEHERLKKLAAQNAKDLEVFQYNKKRCLINHTVTWENCLNVAQVFETGQIVPKSLDDASHYYHKACDVLNDGFGQYYEDRKGACLRRAHLLEAGYGSSPDTAREVIIIMRDQLCDGAKDGQMCHRVGELYERGYKTDDGRMMIEADSTTAREYLKKSCDAGFAQACDEVKTLEPDINEEYIVSKAACEKDDAANCVKVAEILLEAKALQLVDWKWAWEDPNYYLKRACDLEDVYACFKLAERFEGDVFTHKGAEVRDLYQKVCTTTGRDRACDEATRIRVELIESVEKEALKCDTGQSGFDCYIVGRQYHEGIFVPQNFDRAVLFYSKSCNMGYLSSCRGVADMLKERGSNGDLSKAVKFLAKGCEFDNDSMVCFELGEMYEAGHGVPPSKSKAKKLYKIALKGRKDTCKWAKERGDENHYSCDHYEELKAKYGKR